MNSPSRRRFIQMGAAGAGLAGLAGATAMGARPGDVADPGTEGDRVVPTFCEMCFWKCGLLAHVRGGRVTKVTGNPDHPLSNGRLCPRGAGATGLLHDPDRLRAPLLRRSRRGEEVFEEVSWDDALGRVAEGMDRIRTEHGPGAMALFSHGYGGSWFKQLFDAYGSATVAAPSYAQCRGPRDAGYQLTFGRSLGSPENIDLAHARVIVLIGSHLGENMHNTQVQDLAAAIGRGAELVVVDPRFSTAAGKARHWLPIRPGTDVALLLAWMNVILEEGRYDADYVDRYAVGLDRLKAEVEGRTPEWAWPLTGIRPDLIRESARLVASARPASLVHPGRHATWDGQDTQRARAMAILAALLGSWGRRGGYVLPEGMKVPPYPRPEAPPRAPVADRPAPGSYPFAAEVLADGVRDASQPEVGAIRGWMVYGTNLLQALPGPEATRRALAALDLVVAIDVLPAEICGWADVVLPETTFLERWDDLWAPSYERPFVALRQPAVSPMYDSRPGSWIARELGHRLGLGAHFPWTDAEEFVRFRAGAAGLDWEALRRTGVALGARVPVAEEEGRALVFGTPSGRIELFSQALADRGFDPIPVFRPPDPLPPGSFHLLSGRTAAHTFGRTTNNRLLSQVYDENEVWVNPTAAAALPGYEARPLADGERVILVNQDGARAGPVRLRLTERIRGDCVWLVHGYGHTAQGLRFARGRGASDADLLTRVPKDPIMGGTGMNTNTVRIERPAEVVG